MALNFFFRITFILIFISELFVNGCMLEVSQPKGLISGDKNQSITIPCHVNSSTCNAEVFWYMFTSKSYHQLDTKNQPLKYQVQKSHLWISSLSDNDNGLYYCAATLSGLAISGSQAFGHGTTLTVNEPTFYPGRAVLLVLLVLLTLYSLTILTLIICIKTGRRVSFLKGRFRRSDVKSDSSKRTHFGAVVQELYSKRNLNSNKKHSIEVSQENKCETPRSPAEKEDIYQNLNRTR